MTAYETEFESKYVEVLGSKMHYIESGTGDPILFIHGIPTYSYLWRNIIPEVKQHGRCIAIDLIGAGYSDKPDIEYTVFDHINYLDGFINALGLKSITLVLHAWGSVIGFDYAARNPGNVKALAFMEAHLRAATRQEMSLPLQEIVALLESPEVGKDVILNSNYYVNKVLPYGVIRQLSDEEMQAYRKPFEQPGSCLPIWQYLQDLPKGDGGNPKVIELINRYSAYLQENEATKLMLYAVPGYLTTIETVQWAKQNIPNLTQVDIGDALHYAQESKPKEFAKELNSWLEGL